MANRRVKGNTYRGVVIDTAPGTGGYWTEGVKSSEHKVHALILSIAGTFSGTVTLQFRPIGDSAWSTYDTYTETTRQIIEDYTNCEWRAGIASGGFTSGTPRVRIEYHDGENR